MCEHNWDSLLKMAAIEIQILWIFDRNTNTVMIDKCKYCKNWNISTENIQVQDTWYFYTFEEKVFGLTCDLNKNQLSFKCYNHKFNQK